MSDGPTAPLRTHPGVRLTIQFSARDHDHHGSLLVRIMQRARAEGLAGATAFEAHVGFGASGRMHRTRLVADDAPVAVVIVDESEPIHRFLVAAESLLAEVMVTLADVEIVEVEA